MDGFKIHVVLEADDVRSYAKAKRSPQDIVATIFMWLGFAFVYIVGTGFIHSLTGEWWIGVAVMLLAVYGLNKFFGRHKTAEYEKVADQFVDYDLIVNRDGIVQKVGRTETKYAWPELAIVERRDEFLEMKMWDESVIVVPKHLFTEEEDFVTACSFIEEQQKWAEAGHA